MKLVEVGFEGPDWATVDEEGSGGSGSGDRIDVIFDSVTMTSTDHTSINTTTLSPTVIKILTTLIREASTSSTANSTATTDKPSPFPGIMLDKVYIFVGVFVVLVFIAVGICLYIKFVHERRSDSHSFTPTLR